MRNYILLMIIFISASCAQNDSYNVAYDNGSWFNGEEFIQTTFHSSDGFFLPSKPARIDTTINLEGSYVIPPFCEAHSHHYDTPYLLEAVNELSLRDGVFYGISMTNWVDAKEEVRSFFLNETSDGFSPVMRPVLLRLIAIR